MNLPNKLSLTRIILVPVFMCLYLMDFIPYGKLIAAAVFILAALTDMWDGQIARKHNLITDLGKLLDPIADKMLLLGGLLVIMADGIMLIEFLIVIAFLVVARDHLVNSYRQIGASKGVIFAAVFSGKIKSIILYIAIIMAMALGGIYQANFFSGLALDICTYATYGMLALGGIFTVYSAIDYTIKNKAVLASKNEKADGKAKD